MKSTRVLAAYSIWGAKATFTAPADPCAGAAADRLVQHLGEPAAALALKALVKLRGDREAEHAVAEEGEALVGRALVLDPGGVRERLFAQVTRKGVDQLAEAQRGFA